MKNLRSWIALAAVAVFVAGAAAIEAQGTGWLSLLISESSGAVQARALNTYGAPIMVGRGTATPTVANSGSPPMDGELYVVTADSTEPELLFYSNNTGAFTSIMRSTLLGNQPDDANSITFASNTIVFEGATADAAETTFQAADPTVDLTYQLQDKVAADTLLLLDQGLGPLSGTTVEVPNLEFSSSVNAAPRFKWWARTFPTYTSSVPATNSGIPTACNTTGVNYLFGPSVVGYGFESFAIGDNSICAVDYAAADGAGFHADAEDNTGMELSQGIVDGSPGAFTIGTSPAFYMSVRFAIATVANTDACYVGFRAVEAVQDTIATYTDYFLVGVGNRADAGPGDFFVIGEINGTGAIAVDLAETDWADDQVHTLTVLVSATGVTTAQIEGTLVADSGVAQTFDDTDIVVPILHCKTDNTTTNANVDVVFWEVGLQ